MRPDKSVNDSFDIFRQTWLRWKTIPLTADTRGKTGPKLKFRGVPQTSVRSNDHTDHQRASVKHDRNLLSALALS